MAPPNPKRPPRPPRPPGAPAPKKEEVELPFDDDEVAPLQEDDPRPQRVPQFPAGPRRLSGRHRGQREGTRDRELATRFDATEYSDPGHVPAFLYVERGPGAGQLIPVKQGLLIIGRASNCDLRLQHPSISRRHAQLLREGERFVLRDLGSQNGTFVNRVKLSGEQELRVGDELSVGNAVLKLRGSGVLPERAPHSPAEPVGRPSRKGMSLTRVALMAAAVGSAAAALLTVAVVKLTRASESPLAAQPASTGEGEGLTESTPAAEEEVDDEPPPALAEGLATEPEAKPPRALTPSNEPPLLEPLPTPLPPPVDRADVIALYEKGEVDGALQLARRGELKPLATKLSEYQSAIAAAREALHERNTTGAISHLSIALAVDQALSQAGAARTTQLRKQLARLYTQLGQEQLKTGAEEAARESFQRALEYDPSNTWARSELQALGSGR